MLNNLLKFNILQNRNQICMLYLFVVPLRRRDGRAVDCGGLENR